MDWGAFADALATTLDTILSFVSTSMTNSDRREMNAEALRLAYIQREDALRQEGIENRMARHGLGLQTKGLEFQEREARFGRAERAEERGYERREHAFDKTLNMVNKNKDMRNQLVGIFPGRESKYA